MNDFANRCYRNISWVAAFLIHRILYEKKSYPKVEKIKKILVIILDYIGDNILSQPTFDILKEHFPTAQIDVMVGEWTKDLYKAHPGVRRVIPYNCAWLNRGKSRWSLRRRLSVLTQVYSEKYDLIVDVRGSFATLALALFKASKYRADTRVSFARDLISRFERKFFGRRDGFFVDARRPYRVVEMFRQIGINHTHPPKAAVFVPEDDKKEMRRILSETGLDINKKIVSFHPCAAEPLKLWENKKWAQAGDELIQRYGVQLVVSGTKTDLATIEGIIRLMQKPAFNLAGKMTLMQLAALIDLSALCVCLDSGPMHIAGALHVPVIGLFGADDPKTCAPWTDRCRLLFHGPEGPDRMQLITTDEVLAAADYFLFK